MTDWFKVAKDIVGSPSGHNPVPPVPPPNIEMRTGLRAPGGYSADSGPDLPQAPKGGTGETRPEWLEHLSVLRLEPGDTIVLRTSGDPAPDEASDVTERVEEIFPGHRCILLTGGMELGVVRTTETAP